LTFSRMITSQNFALLVPGSMSAGARLRRAGDLRGHDEQNSVSILALGVYPGARAVGRADDQDLGCDGSTLVCDLSGQPGPVYGRRIFPEPHKADAGALF